MTQAEARKRVLGMVGAIRRRWTARQVGRLVLGGAAGAAAWILAMVVLDNVAMLGRGGLLAGWAALAAAGLAYVGAAAWVLTVGRPTSDRFALMYERRAGAQHNRLINALQFLLQGKAESDPMARATVLENAERIVPASASAAVPPGRLWRAALAAAGCLAALAAYVALRPELARNALARLLHPASPPPHLLATDIRVAPGDTTVLEGSPVVVTADLAHHLPARVARQEGRRDSPRRASLEYRLGRLPQATVEMARLDARRFRSDAFTSVTMPITYRVRAGRSTSPWHVLAVQYRPRVEALQVSVTRPAYAGGGTTHSAPNVGDVSGLAGSAVEVHLTANNPLAEARLEMSDGSTVAAEVAPKDPRGALARFVLDERASYAPRLKDVAGVTNVHPPRYTISAVPDQPPTVMVTRPGRDLIVPAASAVEVTVEAGDDIGLGTVVLETRSPGRPWQVLRQWDFEAPDVRREVLRADLRLADLGVRANQALLYRVAAEDRREPTRNRTVGRTWAITAAESSAGGALLAGQHERLLDLLARLVQLQRENRAEFDSGAPLQPVRVRQNRIRDLTLEAADKERRAIRPTQSLIHDLTHLAGGAMLATIQSLVLYRGPDQADLKAAILKNMDYIIAQLEAILRRTRDLLEAAEKAQAALEKMTPQERAALQGKVQDEIKRLRDFVAEQDKVIEGVEELERKAEDLTGEDHQKLEKMKGVEDQWAEIFQGRVKDIEDLARQNFADATITDDYKEMVEQIEEASKKLDGQPKTIHTGAESSTKAARQSAEEIKEAMEMWLAAGPDTTKWVMDNPPQKLEMPLFDLPKELFDLIGELIEDQDALNDASEDVTSGNVSPGQDPTWGVGSGPISTYAAQGKTGNQLPDNDKIGGRSGDGRAGPSQGQSVEDVAKGLPGRKSETGVTNDPYEEGVIKELQQLATGGATGGGKGRGSGQEGLEGESPPPLFDNLREMRQWQQRVRQKAERVASQLKVFHMNLPDFNRALELMRRAEKEALDGRYEDLAKTQQMIVRDLRSAADLRARPSLLRVDQAYEVPVEERGEVLDALDEPVPDEYGDAVRRYFQKLSEN
jgi:hypothetical protein